MMKKPVQEGGYFPGGERLGAEGSSDGQDHEIRSFEEYEQWYKY